MKDEISARSMKEHYRGINDGPLRLVRCRNNSLCSSAIMSTRYDAVPIMLATVCCVLHTYQAIIMPNLSL